MLKNYLLIALRQIKRNKLHSFINIFGLAVGFASTLLILQFIQDELSYDSFHQDADRTYRISSHSKIGDNERHWSLVPSTVAPAVISEIPGITSHARITTLSGANQVVAYDNQFYDESIGTPTYGRVYRVDSTILDIFDYKMMGLQGSKALAQPNTVVISRDAANKIFKEEEPLGKVLEFSNLGGFEVTSVIEEVPSNSHFQFDYLLSFDFNSANSPGGFFWVRSYIMLKEEALKKTIEEQLGEVGRAAQPSLADNGVHMDYFLQNVQDIHLTSGLEYELYPTNDINVIFIFLAVSFFILIIATINFVNLSAAELSARSKEMGLRKVMGSNKSQMLLLFFTHSVLTCFLALAFSFILLYLSIELFNEFSGKQLEIISLLDPLWLGGILCVIAVISIATGLYPTSIISRFNPAIVIKENLSPGSKSQWFRKLLVVFQFAISVTLIVSTFIVIKQFDFMSSKNLGFETDQIINVRIDGNLSDPELNILKQELTSFSAVETASLATGMPGVSTNVSVMRPEGFDESNTQRMDMIYADFDFIKTMDIQLLSGRDFNPQIASDSLNFMINKSAADQFGWSVEEAIGKDMHYLSGPVSGKSGKVIGVMDDFHYLSLHNEIGPLYLGIRSSNFNVMNFRFLALKINLSEIGSTLGLIQNKWTELSPEKPLNFNFLDAAVHEKYEKEQRLGAMITTFAILAIGIACLGLLGLASFVVQQKTKEIGIRKVLGASLLNIWSRLSLSFILLVVVGNLMAWPVAYFFMEGWLDDFAYRIDIPAWIFILAGITSVTIALFIIGFRTTKAALVNPIESIRYE